MVLQPRKSTDKARIDKRKKELSRGDVLGLYNLYHCGKADRCLLHGPASLPRNLNNTIITPAPDRQDGGAGR